MLSCKTYEWLERSSYICPYVTEERPDARFISFVKASTVGLAFAGSGHARRRMIMVPGAYFRDETIWRGRMIEFACDLKATGNWPLHQRSVLLLADAAQDPFTS